MCYILCQKQVGIATCQNRHEHEIEIPDGRCTDSNINDPSLDV